jgi:5'-nucleotidase
MNEIRGFLRSQPLRIGVSTRALFNLEEEHSIFVKEGVQAYAALQLERENTLIGRGTGFEVVERLLRLNEANEKPYVEVYLLSRNSPDLSLRAFNSIAEYGLGIRAGSFTSGRSLGPFISAWEVDLFLSNEACDVQAAISAGAAAAKLGIAPKALQEIPGDEVRIAFDGDVVVFSPESDEIYKQQGLTAFLLHERNNATKPMGGGPFGNFLKKLSILRRIYMNDAGVSRVRIAIVTARNAPAHARVVHTVCTENLIRVDDVMESPKSLHRDHR